LKDPAVEKISLIFPMAGQGARFGYRFKPFLTVGGETFIEAAFAPFRPWLAQISQVHFVFTAEQENAHAVRLRLTAMFADIPHDTAILDRSTTGPAQTLERCLEMKGIEGPILVCDCDHAVDVEGLMRAVRDPAFACAVPTWPLDAGKLSAWSVAAVRQDGRIAAVAEKALPQCEEARGLTFRGVIGCYYFADSARVRRLIATQGLSHISDVMADYLKTGQPVFSVPAQRAHFFGDPARLAEHNARRVAAPQA
jgi:GTP:adenosylcobinamide-phosphate guanylyltransferase